MSRAILFGVWLCVQLASCQEDAEQDLEEVSLLQQRLQVKAAAAKHDNHPAIPSIIYIKTHKTGSSTLFGILARMIDIRDMTTMVPVGTSREDPSGSLGYPWPFPGIDNYHYYGEPEHQFQSILFHAVLNVSLMQAYVKKPHSIRLTILRDPMDTIISTYNYMFRHLTWDEFLSAAYARNLSFSDQSLAINPQSFGLGWYDFVGGQNFDNDQAKISEWLAILDKYFDNVVILERIDECLVLLGDQLKVDIEEMKYLVLNSNDEKVMPSEIQRQKVQALINVDSSLYDHFKQRFLQRWDTSARPKLGANLEILRNLNHELQDACTQDDAEACSKFKWGTPEWRQHFQKKQSVA